MSGKHPKEIQLRLWMPVDTLCLVARLTASRNLELQQGINVKDGD
jgi:hypothetical protein